MMETKPSLGKMPFVLGDHFGEPLPQGGSQGLLTGGTLLGAPYSPIGLKILVTLKEKLFKAFTFLVLPEPEA